MGRYTHHRPRIQTRTRTAPLLSSLAPIERCPKCAKGFQNISRVLAHLSNAKSSCSDAWFPDRTGSSVPETEDLSVQDNGDQDWVDEYDNPHLSPNLDNTPPSKSTDMHYSEYFPGASTVHGPGQSFLDCFNSDQFSSERRSNLFYPFASQSEWETASFLLRSGMSTRAIDEFFTLPMVSLLAKHVRFDINI